MQFSLYCFRLLISLCVLTFSAIQTFASEATKNPFVLNSNLNFTENKGQLTDQFNNSRPDILFSGTDGALSFFLKSNGISYQQIRVDKWDYENEMVDGLKTKKATQSTSYRIDVNWLNTNSETKVLKKNPLHGSSNFYTIANPDGISHIKSYSELIYDNIYDGINLKWYQKDNHLKYDFIVSPNANYKNIQLEINGALSIFIETNGNLIIETPLGKIIEEAPYVTQGTTVLKSKWVLNKNIVSFEIENYNPTLELIIDPGVRIWGTYYGGNGGDSSLNSAIDSNGNVYMAGTTSSANGSSIATSGSHQFVFGGGQDNGYIVKFNSAGVRQWATYYGGPVREFGLNCAIDNAGNVFLVGHTLSAPGNIVATAGCHQPVFGGTWDAYIVKLNSNGIRQWGTYYGGPGLEHGNGVATDAFGNVYLCGKTDAPTSSAMATSGCHQSNFGGVEDGFLVKFNGAGVRQWSTYYGGTGTDIARGVSVDALNNVYITGWTDNSVANVIGSPGSHQNVFGGGSLDAFIVKFNSAGVRQWGTQYGGNGTDQAYDCDIDASGNVYMVGKTSSSFSISTPGSHQPIYGGGAQDAFLTCFNSSGVRQWGTYNGGTGDEEAWGCAIHNSGHIFIAGLTSSTNGTSIATPGSHQSVYGGGSWDGFLTQFDPTGLRTWGTYYGETGGDVVYGCSTDNVNHVYIVGSTDTNTGNAIATAGSHQVSYAGGFGDAFLVKFYDCPPPISPSNITSTTNLIICSGNSTTLHVVNTNTVNWYTSPTSTNSIGTGTTFITPILNAGIITYYAEAVTCAVSATRTAISVTVNPTPTLSIVASPTLICAGKSSTLNVSGATSYTWSNSATTSSIQISPLVTNAYSVIGTNNFGCSATESISITVYPLDPISLTAQTNTVCLTIFGGSPVTLVGVPPGGTYAGPNVVGNTLNPTALGIFVPTYSIVNSINGCVSTASTSIEVFNCLSIAETSAEKLGVFIYPNPSIDVLYLERTTVELLVFKLYDGLGKTIIEGKSKNKLIELKLHELSGGTYFLEIQTNNKTGHFKILKE